MPTIADLPTELVNFVAQYLDEIDDLAAFAKTNRRYYEIVNPVLYKVANETETEDEPFIGYSARFPLGWAAIKGQVGTLKKALAAGASPNYRFEHCIDKSLRDSQSFYARSRDVDGKDVFGAPKWDPTGEWQPSEDDVNNSAVDKAKLVGHAPGCPHHHAHTATNNLAHQHQHHHHHHIDDDEDDYDDEDDHHPLLYNPFMDDDDEDMDLDDFSDDYYDDFDSDESEDYVLREFTALHLAARAGHTEVIKVLLDHGADINVGSENFCDCSMTMARSHLAYFGGPIASEYPSYWTPLHAAICHFQTDAAKLLLSRGALIAVDKALVLGGALTALHNAAAWGQVEMCKFLLDGFVDDVDVKDLAGLSPFYHAFANGHWDTTIPFLLEKGANIDFVVANAEDIEYRSNESLTVLYEACAFGRYEDAIRLVELGADLTKGASVAGTQVWSPLHAVCRPSRSIVEPARNVPGQARVVTKETRIEEARQKLIELMISKGADVEVKSCVIGGIEKSTPLHYAAHFCITSALKPLLAANANVSARNSVGHTPLMEACLQSGPPQYCITHQYNSAELISLVKLLLDHGSRINATDKNGNPVLHRVCGSNMAEPMMKDIVRFLLDSGANDSIRNKANKTAFQIAFYTDRIPVCDILMRRRKVTGLTPKELNDMADVIIHERPYSFPALDLLYDIDVKRHLYSKSTPLLAMVERSQFDLAVHYLLRGTPVLTDEEKEKIFLTTVQERHWKMAKRMIEMDVDVDCLDRDGRTSLLKLVGMEGHTWGSDEFVWTLLDAGADMHFKSGSHVTPLQKAIMEGRQSILQWMLERRPLRHDHDAPKGVYLHAAVQGGPPSKGLLALLIRAGASLTELDKNGDTPLSLFLKNTTKTPIPGWLVNDNTPNGILPTWIWYLWRKDLDITHKNKQGKSVLDYLTMMRMYRGANPIKIRVAKGLHRRVRIVNAGETGKKTLQFPQALDGSSTSRAGASRVSGI